jgi:hypothetical protein
MRKLSLLILAAFFFLNPGVACMPDEPEWQYGASELRAAIEGDWALTLTPTGGEPQDYVITLKQAKAAPASASRGTGLPFVRAAHACNDRTLLASANACESGTVMPLSVTLAQGSPAVNGTPSASFNVRSLVFTQGDLFLMLGDRHVSATVSADGTVLKADFSIVSVGPAGTATLHRVP